MVTLVATRQARNAVTRAQTTFSALHGRSAAYRRPLSRRYYSLVTSLHPPLKTHDPKAAFLTSSTSFPLLTPAFSRTSSTLLILRNPTLQTLHSSLRNFSTQKNSDPADPADTRSTNSTSDSKSGEEEPKQDTSSKSSDSSESEGEKKDSGKRSSEPPPPPHGDKSPWQVFAETLRSEFKASKEWNESTKALASSAHQFTENESVKRARAAYSAASGAATSKTSGAFKATGKALGQGAAWTWDTPVVKGIRGGVNATGRGIEKATRPVRETKAFQNIKDTVDDGSSSRYGGWVEKEERRKQRELREMKASKSGPAQPEKMEEDPK